MTAPSIAWGELHLFKMPDGSHIYGREFELLPAGTMFAAGVILHGISGVIATVNSDDVATVAANAEIELYAVRNTMPHELDAYQSDVIESYRLRQLQDAQT